MPRHPILKPLKKLKRSLSEEASFCFHMLEDGCLYIDLLSIPERGRGTQFFADVLTAADQHQISVKLEACATDRPGDPGEYELVRWYYRFGFQLDGHSGDGANMVRSPRACTIGKPSVLEDYNAAKLSGLDISRSAYDEWRDGELNRAKSDFSHGT